MPNNSLNYIDAVNRPFDYHADPRQPSGYPEPTIPLYDYWDANTATAPQIDVTETTTSIIGVGMYFAVGSNNITDVSFSIEESFFMNTQTYIVDLFYIASDGTIPTLTVTVPGPEVTVDHDEKYDVMSVSSSKTIHNPKGAVQTNTSAKPGKKVGATNNARYFMQTFVNYATINGFNAGYDYEQSMITAFRLISAGIRFLPTIELITDSSTVAVSKFYGASLSPATLYRCGEQGEDIFTILRNSPDYIEYPNKDGVSGRVQPYQDQILNMTKMNALETYSAQADTSEDTSAIYFPVLVARFTAPISLSTLGTVSLPVRPYCRVILESILNLPTPIISDKTNLDPRWCDKLKMFQFDTNKYPVIVKGHTFERVLKTVDAISNVNSNLAKQLAVLRKEVNNAKMLAKRKSQKIILKGRNIPQKVFKQKSVLPKVIYRAKQKSIRNVDPKFKPEIVIDAVKLEKRKKRLAKLKAKREAKRRMKALANTNFMGYDVSLMG